MAGRLRLNDWAWPALALGFAAASAGAWWAWGLQGADRAGWMAAPLAGSGEPWRWWASALVHVNAAHLEANLWACAVVAAWGWTARVGLPQALAWWLAWPLAQALLVTDPGTLQRYAGLSATLHAGAAIGCWHLLWQARGARRAVGAAVSLAIAIKLALEVPAFVQWWSASGVWAAQPLPDAPGHIVAGHAHGCGVLAGVLAAGLVDGIMALGARIRRRSTAP